MSAPASPSTDEPHHVHDLRCAVWTTLADPCDCRDASTAPPRVDELPDLPDHWVIALRAVIALRGGYEQAWADMPLCERAAELDRIAAEGHTA